MRISWGRGWTWAAIAVRGGWSWAVIIVLSPVVVLCLLHYVVVPRCRCGDVAWLFRVVTWQAWSYSWAGVM